MIQGLAWIPSGIMIKSELSCGLMWSLVWVLTQDLNRTNFGLHLEQRPA